MKPEFYVIRLGRVRDGNKPVYGQMPPQQAPRNRDRAIRGFEDQLAPQQLVDDAVDAAYAEVNGFGQELQRQELRDPVISFTTREIAEVHAKQLAMKNPKVLYGVLGVISIFESAPAEVFEKTFNDAGELVLKEPGEAE